LPLTPSGRDAIEGLIPLVVDKLNLLLGDFTTVEVQELLRLLIKLNASLQSSVEPVAAGVEA
jgi:DNA-binding MarR family transcriptional regulator